MPLSSQMHSPKLMGQDDVYIKYGFPKEDYEADGHETKDTEDGVTVTMGKRKSDGQMSVMECAFKKAMYDEKKAGDWIAAQKFSLEPADMHSVKGVEIFSTGVWNGKQISEKDLDLIVHSFNDTQDKVRPFLKLGHDEDQKLLQSDGLPAAGWVENVRKVGSKLVADFVDIPKKIYQLIKNNAYRKVSCEIYNNIDIDGKAYPKLLGAVALLGADLPGVLNLNDILSMYCVPRDLSAIEKFATSQKPVIMTNEPPKKEMKKMPDADLEVFKAKLEQSDKALQASQTEIEKYKSEAAEAQKKLLEVSNAAKKARMEAFVSSAQAAKICTPAMKPLVLALLGDEVETYAIGDDKLSKDELVWQVLKFATEASKVNFEETTKETKEVQADLEGKIEKYAAEHKCDYGSAYRAVTKGLDLSAQPL